MVQMHTSMEQPDLGEYLCAPEESHTLRQAAALIAEDAASVFRRKLQGYSPNMSQP